MFWFVVSKQYNFGRTSSLKLKKQKTNHSPLQNVEVCQTHIANIIYKGFSGVFGFSFVLTHCLEKLKKFWNYLSNLQSTDLAPEFWRLDYQTWKYIMLFLVLYLNLAHNCYKYHEAIVVVTASIYSRFSLFQRIVQCKSKQKIVFKLSNFFWRDDWVSKLNLRLSFCYGELVTEKCLESCLMYKYRYSLLH